MWKEIEGQESFPVSAGFEFTTQGLLVIEHYYSATTHTPQNRMIIAGIVNFEKNYI